MTSNRGPCSQRRRAPRRRQPHLRPDDDAELQRLRLPMRPHHTRQRTLIGNRQRAVAQGLRPRNQFLGLRSPVQETEVAAAAKLGVVRKGEVAA